MKKYVVTGTKCQFNPGAVLKLSPDLARSRLHNLQKIDRDTYLVVNKVEFKRGTEIEFGGEVNKALLQILAVKGSDEAAQAQAGQRLHGDAKAGGQESVLSDEHVQIIAEAVSSLDPGNDAHWTAEGVPAVSAVRDLLGGIKIYRGDIDFAAPDITREFLREKNLPGDDKESSSVLEQSGNEGMKDTADDDQEDALQEDDGLSETSADEEEPEPSEDPVEDGARLGV